MPKRAKARARPESILERAYTPLATNIPLMRKHNQPKADRIDPANSAKAKKKRNTKGASHHHFEVLNNLSIFSSPIVIVFRSVGRGLGELSRDSCMRIYP
jgi:hypothetical protein